jgi:hypothetical protein
MNANRPKTIADLEMAARQVAARLTRLGPEHHGAEVPRGPRTDRARNRRGGSVGAGEGDRYQGRGPSAAADGPLPPPGYNDPAAVVVRELRRHRLLDRLEAIPAHQRAQTIREDVAAGRFDRLDALLEVDEHGELVALADLEALRIERGRIVAPALAAQLDQAEADPDNVTNAAPELGIMAANALKTAGLGSHADLVDRSAFLGQPTLPASFREHVQADAEPAPAA